jgi:hypothetical protein
LEVEDLIADGNAAARRPTLRTEDSERQILDRELRVAVRRSDPAHALGIMRLVSQSTHRILSVRRQSAFSVDQIP